jgi:hypothetical protein
MQIDPIFVNAANLKLGIKESEDSTQRKLIYQVPFTESKKLSNFIKVI